MIPTEISASLAMKLASAIVHAHELDPHGEGWEFDLASLKALVDDEEVVAWLAEFGPGLLPEKRS